jgi:hypothetical protein
VLVVVVVVAMMVVVVQPLAVVGVQIEYRVTEFLELQILAVVVVVLVKASLTAVTAVRVLSSFAIQAGTQLLLVWV